MALTFASTEILFRGTYTFLVTEVTFDTSYATGGETLSPSSVGLREIAWIIPGSSEGFEIEAIKTNPSSWLLQMFANSANTNTATEIASGLDRSAVSVDCLIIGR